MYQGEGCRVIGELCGRVRPEVGACVAVVRVEGCRTGVAGVRVACDHAEARREGGDADRGVIRHYVVDLHAAVGGREALVRYLGHFLKGSIAGAEVQHLRPVVGSVLVEETR